MRCLACVLICAAVQLFVPSAADAWYGDVDSWSGPGPFSFIDVQFRVLCTDDKSSSTLASLDDLNNKWWAVALGAGCVDASAKRPRAWLNAKAAFWWSRENNLKYLPSAEVPTVRVLQFEPAYSGFIDPRKFVELSSGWGVLFVFADVHTTRFYVKPIGLAVSPFATTSSRILRAIRVRADMLVLPRGFDATDFGAIPGTFHTDHEVNRALAITWDPTFFR